MANNPVTADLYTDARARIAGEMRGWIYNGRKVCTIT